MPLARLHTTWLFSTCPSPQSVTCIPCSLPCTLFVRTDGQAEWEIYTPESALSYTSFSSISDTLLSVPASRMANPCVAFEYTKLAVADTAPCALTTTPASGCLNTLLWRRSALPDSVTNTPMVLPSWIWLPVNVGWAPVLQHTPASPFP